MDKKNATKEDLVIDDIIEVFEEFLNMKDVELPNSEKESIPKDTLYPNIIGCDYGYLVGRITELFRFWNISCNKDKECQYCLQYSTLSHKRRAMRSRKFFETGKEN